MNFGNSAILSDQLEKGSIPSLAYVRIEDLERGLADRQRQLHVYNNPGVFSPSITSFMNKLKLHKLSRTFDGMTQSDWRNYVQCELQSYEAHQQYLDIEKRNSPELSTTLIQPDSGVRTSKSVPDDSAAIGLGPCYLSCAPISSTDDPILFPQMSPDMPSWIESTANPEVGAPLSQSDSLRVTPDRFDPLICHVLSESPSPEDSSENPASESFSFIPNTAQRSTSTIINKTDLSIARYQQKLIRSVSGKMQVDAWNQWMAREIQILQKRMLSLV